MDFIIIIGFFFIVILILGILKAIDEHRDKRNLSNRIKSIKNFKTSDKFVSKNGKSGIAIDKFKKEVCLFYPSGMSKIVPYNDIISCEIYEDGFEMTKTSRTSQIAGVAVGGLLLGGAGAIVGGLSGKRRSLNKINSINLRIIINSVNMPSISINFLNVECKKNSVICKEAQDEVQCWYSMLKVIIKQADIDNSNTKTINQQNHPENTLIADELRKLVELKNDGILTNEEFESQKKKLLSGSIPVAENKLLHRDEIEKKPTVVGLNNKVKLCPYCGKTINIDATTCIFCLKKVGQPEKTDGNNKEKEKIYFQCDGCGTKYSTNLQNTGKKIRCKKCNSIFNVPQKE
jgi:hypothetical protein